MATRDQGPYIYTDPPNATACKAAPGTLSPLGTTCLVPDLQQGVRSPTPARALATAPVKQGKAFASKAAGNLSRAWQVAHLLLEVL